MASSTTVAVVGATGYGGAELTKYLHDHPTFRLDYLTSQSYVGERFSSVYPSVKGQIDHTCEELQVDRLREHDLVFFALPHGESMKIIPELDRSQTRVVDLAADYRFNNPERYSEVYDEEHLDPEGLRDSVYGLTEHFAGEISSADLVACPGCYATSMLLPLLMLDGANHLEGTVFVDSKSGVSGAGRSPSSSNTFVRCNEDVRPYDVAEHRHQSEVHEYLDSGRVTFVPHVVSADRGIESVLYCQMESERDAREASDHIQSEAEDHELVRYREQPAGMKAVANTPYADLSAIRDGRSLLLFSYLDNLTKGAATQAIQNANLMTGQEGHTGLRPVD